MLKKPVLFVVGLLVMAAMLGLARAFETFPGDEWALLEMRQWRGGWLDDAAILLTGSFGGSPVVVAIPPLVAAGVLSMYVRWADALLVAAAPLAPAVNLGLKELAARPRPDIALSLVEETGYAFPSGHAAFAAAYFGALIYVLNFIEIPDGISNPYHKIRRTAQGALLLMTLAIGASRVWLGVHWPSDVVGGFLFGAVYLAALVAVRRMVEARR